jgi:hypothetical protein
MLFLLDVEPQGVDTAQPDLAEKGKIVDISGSY